MTRALPVYISRLLYVKEDMCNAYCIVTSFPPLAVVVKAERESPAPCEVQSAIRLLKAKTFIPAEIHRKIVEGYGESAI